MPIHYSDEIQMESSSEDTTESSSESSEPETIEIQTTLNTFDEKLIMAIANVSFSKAKAALEKNRGDILKALNTLGYRVENDTSNSSSYLFFYEVENILDRKDNTFLVKWKGYDVADSTWEPLENLNCNEKIIEYLKTL